MLLNQYIKTRHATKNDLDFYFQCICDLEDEIFEKKQFGEIFLENIENPNNYYLVLHNEKESIGIITLHTQRLIHHCGWVGEIQEFYICPNYRGKGYGNILMESIKKISFSKQIVSLEVTSGKKRLQNVEIYTKLGFQLTHNKFTLSNNLN